MFIYAYNVVCSWQLDLITQYEGSEKAESCLPARSLSSSPLVLLLHPTRSFLSSVSRSGAFASLCPFMLVLLVGGLKCAQWKSFKHPYLGTQLSCRGPAQPSTHIRQWTTTGEALQDNLFMVGHIHSGVCSSTLSSTTSSVCKALCLSHPLDPFPCGGLSAML